MSPDDKVSIHLKVDDAKNLLAIVKRYREAQEKFNRAMSASKGEPTDEARGYSAEWTSESIHLCREIVHHLETQIKPLLDP